MTTSLRRRIAEHPTTGFFVLQVLGRLLVRVGEHLLDELVDAPVVVPPRSVDVVEEEPLEERALARSDLDQPADEEPS